MKRGITFRESLLRNVIALMLILGAAILLTMVIASRASAKRLSQQIIDSSMQRADAQFRRFFDEVDRDLNIIAGWASIGMLDDVNEDNLAALNDMLYPVINASAQTSSIMLADPTGQEYLLLRFSDHWRNRLTLPKGADTTSVDYQWTTDNRQPRRIDTTTRYDPRQRPWYTGAVDLLPAQGVARTSIHWTEPYQFFTTKQPGITASVALRRADGRIQVIGIDVLLSDLDIYASSLRVSSNGYLFVLGPTGEFIALPSEGLFDSRAAMQAALLRAPEELHVPLIRDALAAMDGTVGPSTDRTDSGPIRFVSESQPWWGEVIEFPLSTRLSLYVAALVPEADLQGFMPMVRIIIIAIIAVALLLAVIRAFIMARKYSEPIEQLVSESERLSSGNFDPGPPIATRVREMRVLSTAHDHMRTSLQSLVKLERDLLLARQIQQATMPDTLPDVAGYDIGAWNRPADETGGDTYDAIGLANDGRIIVDGPAPVALLMLADATGHGIGPALSAMEIRSMLRMAARSTLKLDAIAHHLNEQLTEDLPEGRFITTWLGQLDAARHTLVSFSGGHGPMFLLRNKTSLCEMIDADAMPFGLVADLDVQLREPITLQPGDVFAVLSDGIFEAMNARDEQFGTERVCQLLVQHAADDAAHIIDTLRATLSVFCAGTTQQDDQTVMLIKRRHDA